MIIVDKSVYTFSKDNEPLLNAKSGDILKFITEDCFGGQIKDESQLVHEIDLNNANPAAGPVFIEGAEVGDVIMVDILDIKVADKGFGCSIGGTGPLADKSETRTKMVEIENGFAKFNDINWKIDPMIGVIGTAPKEGEIANGFAADHGGNMDSKKIVKGTRVYLPVRVEGGLLQIGDLHASMGDGEISGAGLEIPGEVIAKISLIKDFELNWPVTETKDFWYVNTAEVNYNAALLDAASELARLMEPVYNWDITDIFIYMSMQADVGVNQGAGPEDSEMFTSIRLGIPKVAGKEPLIK